MPYRLSPSQVEGLGETALAPQVPTNLNYKLGSHEVFTNPYKGTKHTVENMIRLVKESQGDMVLRRFVENLCRGLRPKDYVSEAAAIYYWSCKNLRYMRDPRLVEMLKSPRYILENYKVGGCDCDDLSVWISSCCSIAGMPVRFVTVGFKPRSLTIRPAYTHVFASAQDVKSNKWMVLDPVAGPRTEAMLKSVKQAAIYDVG